jgi:hypothetical protein
MAPSNHDVRVLSGLVAATLRSIDIYNAAQGKATNLQVKALYARRAIERRQVTAELNREMNRLSGASFGMTGARLSQTPNEPPVPEIALAEAGLLYLCHEAMNDPLLSAPVHSLIRRACDLIKMGQDEMLNLHQLTREAS